MKLKLLPLVLALMITLTACGGDAGKEQVPIQTSTPTNTPAPTPEPTPVVEVTEQPKPEYNGPLNPLTGLPIEEEWVNVRPIAVVVNNLKASLPQLGISKADVIYEVLTEGGITRMLAVYQSVKDVGLIGSVRSARTYFLELALGHDAVFLHGGGSPDAYDKIKAWGVTSLDGVNGPYGTTLFWRDKDRIKNNGKEHSLVTSGETIQELFAGYKFRKDHAEDYVYEMQFSDEVTLSEGKQATKIIVPYSDYKTGVFTYDPQTGKYLTEEYGQKHVDGNTGEQLSVTNVLILKTKCKRIKDDSAGRITVDLSTGDGWFAYGGQIIPIQWSKDGVNGQLVYKTLNGDLVTLGAGNSYVNIIPIENDITIE